MAGQVKQSGASRREVKIARWCLRHPVMVGGAAAVAYGMNTAGPEAMGLGAAGVAAAAGAWARWHPQTFGRWVMPGARSFARRWLTRNYLGPWWRETMKACNLVVKNEGTGEVLVPRVLRVRAWSKTVESVTIRIHKGQSLRQFVDMVPELADALEAVRVAVSQVRPRVLRLIVQRSEPFTETLFAPNMPNDSTSVDLRNLYIGASEYGTDWRVPILDAHWLISGASGSGKGSFTWGVLRGLAPLIRDGLVRIWAVDPKQVELAVGKPIFHRYADELTSIAKLLDEFLGDMVAAQKRMKDAEIRKILAPTREHPINILLIDELAAVMAYNSNDRATSAAIRVSMALIQSQGRASGHLVHGAVQEPQKDVVATRDLFTHRLLLRTTAENHVNQVLGDGARERGALADEIPNIPDTAGIGFYVRPHDRTPLRVRLAYTDDTDITELIEFITNGTSDTGRHLRAVPDAA